MNFNICNNLLSEVTELYNKIPIKEKTFMDISGYPHYENVSSNILAFYFNPAEEHNFKALVINSLIKVLIKKGLNIQLVADIEKLDIYREYITEKGNRIDLVLQNYDFTIGIENKLYASVYNDLEDYANTLNKLNEHSIKILLSLHDNSKKITNTEFINVTYHEFFNQLNIDLENYHDNSNKWYIFIKEFIKNLEDYKGGLEMEEEILNWLKINKTKIEELDKIREIGMKSIENKEVELKSLLEYKLGTNIIKIWNGKTEIGCYIDSPYKYHIDATLNFEGWKIGVFTWTAGNGNKFKQILLNSNYNIIEDDGNHRWLFKYDYNTSIEDISNKVVEIYKYIDNKLKNYIN